MAVFTSANERKWDKMEVSDAGLLVSGLKDRHREYLESVRNRIGVALLGPTEEEVAQYVFEVLIGAFGTRPQITLPARYRDSFLEFRRADDLDQKINFVQLLELLCRKMKHTDLIEPTFAKGKAFQVNNLDVCNMNVDQLSSSSDSGTAATITSAEKQLISTYRLMSEQNKSKVKTSVNSIVKNQQCFAFQDGNCKYGDKCKFSHDSNAAAGCTSNKRCGRTDCAVCLNMANQKQRSVAVADANVNEEATPKGNNSNRWKKKEEAARYLSLSDREVMVQDVDIRRACVSSLPAVQLQLDSGCSSSCITEEDADRIGKRVVAVENGPVCYTATDEPLKVCARADLLAPLPPAHVVEGLKHSLLALKDFTAMDCSVWFPATDMGLQHGAYIYDADGVVVAVTDQNYMLDPLQLEKQVSEMPVINFTNIFDASSSK